MSGKGSSPRPFSISQEQFSNNWDKIFKKTPRDVDDARAEDEAFEHLEELNERTMGREVPPQNN